MIGVTIRTTDCTRLTYISPITQIVQGLAGDVELEDCSFDGLIAEILGHLASLEGYPRLLIDLGHAYNLSTCRYFIPAYFGTMVVPVSIDKCCSGHNLVISCTNPKVVLVRGLPFSIVQLPVAPYKGGRLGNLPYGHQKVEFYRARQLVFDGRNGTAASAQEHTAKWEVGVDRFVLSGFGTYLIYGDSDCGPFMTTNYGGGGVSPGIPGGWLNLLVPVKEEPMCTKGDKICFNSTCRTGSKDNPWYEFSYSVARRGQPTLSRKITLLYNDIIGEMKSCQEWKKHSI